MEEFAELGLTKNEAKAYQTLIKFGKLGATEISNHSTVPYSRIYDILNSLIQKGLVELIPEKIKKFTSTDPSFLINLIESKEKHLQNLKEKVKEMKKFYETKEKNPVIMGVGKKVFHKLVDEMSPPNEFDYSIKWNSLYDPKWARETRQIINQKIDFKSLARYDKETEKDIRKWLKITRNIRQLDNEGVAIAITEKEVLIGLIKSNVTLLIKDQAFCKLLKQLFLNTYKNAQPIT